MPRAIDRRNIEPEGDPNRSGTEMHVAKMTASTAEVLASAMRQFGDSINAQAVTLLKELTGLDFTSGETFMASLGQKFVTGGIEAEQAIRDFFTGLDALNTGNPLIDALNRLVLPPTDPSFPYFFPITWEWESTAQDPATQFFALVRGFLNIDGNADLGALDLQQLIDGFVRDVLTPQPWFTNLLSLFDFPDLDTNPNTFDPAAAVEQFAQALLKPLNIFASLTNGGQLQPGQEPQALLAGLAAIVNGLFGGGTSTATTASGVVGEVGTTVAATANAIAALSAQVARISAEQAAAGFNGRSVTIDFSTRPDANNLGSDFAQTYSGSGSSLWGMRNGRAAVIPVNSANRSASAVYLELETLGDYQSVAAVFATVPQGAGINPARNRLTGRCNAADTTKVFADLTGDGVTLGCVVDGAETVFASASHQFKPNSVYRLNLGTVGGVRVFQVCLGTTPILTHTEVGTTSRFGAGFRRGGAYVLIPSSPFSTNLPAEMAAWSLADNAPAPVLGAGAAMSRRSTASYDIAQGVNDAGNLFDTLDSSTEEIVCNLAQGSFAVSVSDWYCCAAGVQRGGAWPTNLALLLRTNTDSAPLRYGPDLGRFVNPSTANNPPPILPRYASASWVVYLAAGTTVRLGYDATSATTSALTGSATGAGTYFSISRGKGHQK